MIDDTAVEIPVVNIPDAKPQVNREVKNWDDFAAVLQKYSVSINEQGEGSRVPEDWEQINRSIVTAVMERAEAEKSTIVTRESIQNLLLKYPYLQVVTGVSAPIKAEVLRQLRSGCNFEQMYGGKADRAERIVDACLNYVEGSIITDVIGGPDERNERRNWRYIMDALYPGFGDYYINNQLRLGIINKVLGSAQMINFLPATTPQMKILVKEAKKLTEIVNGKIQTDDGVVEVPSYLDYSGHQKLQFLKSVNSLAHGVIGTLCSSSKAEVDFQPKNFTPVLVEPEKAVA